MSFSLSCFGGLEASERDFRIPGEYEQVGSSAFGLLGVGVTDADGVTAIGVNPGLLALSEEYSVAASYSWADLGRDFYQLGVVDAVTSKYSAAFSYTGFQEKPDALEALRERDSLAAKRASVAIAYPLKQLAIGGSLSYVEGVEANTTTQDVYKGLSLGVGIVGYLLPNIRFGLSAQNLNNTAIDQVAPRSYRAGISWAVVPEWKLSLDYKDRQRITSIEGEIEALAGLDLSESDRRGLSDSEKMLYLGSQIQFFDLLHMQVAAGQSVDEERLRQSGAFGLGIKQQKYAFFYTIAKRNQGYADLNSALTLHVFMKI